MAVLRFQPKRWKIICKCPSNPSTDATILKYLSNLPAYAKPQRRTSQITSALVITTIIDKSNYNCLSMWLLTTETQPVGNLLYSHRLGLLRNISRRSLRFVNRVREIISLELFQPVDLTMTNLKIVKRGKDLPPKTMEVVLKKWQLSIFLLHVTQRQIRNQETTVKKKVNYINCCVLQLRSSFSERSRNSTRVKLRQFSTSLTPTISCWHVTYLLRQSVRLMNEWQSLHHSPSDVVYRNFLG